MISRNVSKNRLDDLCKECGCNCNSCNQNNQLHLYEEIETLKNRIQEQDKQIMSMEIQIINHANKYPNGELKSLQDSLFLCNDKYNRLLENYRRLQKVNQNLEDKLLRCADRYESERLCYKENNEKLIENLLDLQNQVVELQKQNEQFTYDYDLIVDLIRNRSMSDMTIDMLPEDLRLRYQKHLEDQPKSRTNSTNSNRIPIPTFPPTAILYSLNNNDNHQDQLNMEQQQKLRHQTEASLRLSKLLNQPSNLCVNCQNSLPQNPPQLMKPLTNFSDSRENQSFIMEMSSSSSSNSRPPFHDSTTRISTTKSATTTKTSAAIDFNDNGNPIQMI